MDTETRKLAVAMESDGSSDEAGQRVVSELDRVLVQAGNTRKAVWRRNFIFSDEEEKPR